MPDEADRPAPMSAKIRFDDLRCTVNSVKSSSGILSSGEGRSVVRNLRFSCFALRADKAECLWDDAGLGRDFLLLAPSSDSVFARLVTSNVYDAACSFALLSMISAAIDR